MIRIGVIQEMAYQWSRSRMGGWAIALRRSPHKHLKKNYDMSNALYLERPLPSNALYNAGINLCFHTIGQ